jgi:tetratricopeptide (TPR) repeat protein
VHADLDPHSQTPYEVHVVLHVADNRFLTPLFRDQLERDVRGELQLAFGELATVEIARQHSLLGHILEKGLQQALDGWQTLSRRTTCFVLIDYANGQYRVQARQQDGMTGLSSPGVRQDSTSDRRMVPALAARLVLSDFGVIGTVTRAGDEVELALKGGKLKGAHGRWVRAGDVFAIARINDEAGKTQSVRVPWALLQAVSEPRDGMVRCRLLRRFKEDDLREPGVLGYRALRLPAIVAPLRLRLLDADSLEPLTGLQVHVRAKPGDKADEYAIDGVLTTRRTYSHAVWVEVLQGSQRVANFPVEIVDDRPVVCRLKVGDADTQAPLEYRRDLWLKRLYDNLRVASERVLELNRLLVGESLEATQKAGLAGLKHITQDIKNLEFERLELLDHARKRKLAADTFLREGDERLEELKKRREDLTALLARVEQAIAKANSPESRALAKLLERARLLESEADFEQALSLYDKFLAQSPDQEKIATYVTNLKKAWAPRSPEHAEARQFVYQAWPRVEPGSLKTEVANARAAFEKCRAAGDRLTLRKFVLIDVLHASNLKKRLDVLKAKDTADNRAEASVIAAVAEELRQLHAEVSAFLRADKQ